MDIVTDSRLVHFVTPFCIGTLFGATAVYYFLQMRAGADSPTEDVLENPDQGNEYRLVMAVRNDLKMQKGKVAAQCCHAAVAAYSKAVKLKPKTLSCWMHSGGAKITVKINSEQELLELDKHAKECRVLSCIIRDAGHTQVAPGSQTVIAIGPAPKSVLDNITGHLKLY